MKQRSIFEKIPAFANSSDGWHAAFAQSEPSMAKGAFHRLVVALQDRLLPALLTGWAYVVVGLSRAVVLPEAVHKPAGFGLPKLIAGKLALHAIGVLCHSEQFRKLRLQRHVRDLRLVELPQKFSDQALRFEIADRLLAAEHLLETIVYVDTSLEGAARFLRDLKDAAELVNRELQDVHRIVSFLPCRVAGSP